MPLRDKAPSVGTFIRSVKEQIVAVDCCGGRAGRKLNPPLYKQDFDSCGRGTHLGPSSPNLSSLLKLRVAIFTSTLDKTLKVGSGGIAALYTLLSPRGFSVQIPISVSSLSVGPDDRIRHKCGDHDPRYSPPRASYPLRPTSLGTDGTPSARPQAGPTASHRSDRVARGAKCAILSL